MHCCTTTFLLDHTTTLLKYCTTTLLLSNSTTLLHFRKTNLLIDYTSTLIRDNRPCDPRCIGAALLQYYCTTLVLYPNYTLLLHFRITVLRYHNYTLLPYFCTNVLLDPPTAQLNALVGAQSAGAAGFAGATAFGLKWRQITRLLDYPTTKAAPQLI